MRRDRRMFGEKRSFWSAAAPVLLVAGLAASGCGHKIEPGEKSLSRETLPPARLETVAERPMPVFREAPGTVRAETTSVISSRIMAVIERVAVDEGDSVTEGQALVHLKSAEMDARQAQAAAGAEVARGGLRTAEEAVGEARAGMALAENTLGRYAKLHEARAVSDQEFDGVSTQATVARRAVDRMEAGVAVARAAVDGAEAALREAEIYRGYTTLRAPQDGLVVARMADAGSMAAPGMPIVKIGGGGFLLEVPLEETLIERVTPGGELSVSIPSIGLEGSGRISAVVPEVDAASRTFVVKIELPREWEKKIAEGIYGTARIPLPAVPRLGVANTAIVRRGQIAGVYVVDAEGVVRFRLVRTGRQDRERTEILSGLQAGEKVVMEDVLRMRDGARMGPLPSGT